MWKVPYKRSIFRVKDTTYVLACNTLANDAGVLIYEDIGLLTSSIDPSLREGYEARRLRELGSRVI